MRTPEGFSMIEIMIVMVMVSLLMLVAVPQYLEQVRATHRVLARAELQKVALRQEQFYIEQRSYARELGELGFPGERYVLARDGKVLPLPGGGGLYLVSMNSSGGAYRVSASPLRADPRCGELSLDWRGVRAAGGPGGLDACW
jgi:type IV pilus assembly protein PilE